MRKPKHSVVPLLVGVLLALLTLPFMMSSEGTRIVRDHAWECYLRGACPEQVLYFAYMGRPSLEFDFSDMDLGFDIPEW